MIRSCEWTLQINESEDLNPGTVAVGELKFEFIADGVSLNRGDEIRYYNDISGRRVLIATCICEKPEYVGVIHEQKINGIYSVTAYDKASLTEKMLSPWLMENQAIFPLSLWEFAQKVAQQCDIQIYNDSLPRSGDYQVQAFYADDLTGRQLLSWVAQAACTFLRATPDGRLEFAWYTENATAGIGPSTDKIWTALELAGELLETADGEVWTFGQEQLGYYSGGLSYEDYTTAPIVKVQIRQTDDDVGVIYPADETGTNALVIQGNLLLTTQTADALRPVAQAIFEIMQGVTYTPMQVDIPYTADAPAPGEIISLTDAYGRRMQTYIMSRTISGQRVTLESTGNARRDSTAAVNEQKYTNLQGKVLEISANVEGLKITAADLQGGMSKLELTVDGLQSTVSGKIDGDQAQTLIDQSLKSISLSATNGSTSSRLTIKAGSTELASAEITFNGLVNFVSKSDLSTAGRTTINGGNVTTGKIGNANGNTLYDLDAGTLRTGRSGSTRVEINDTGIRWYYESYLTGVLYSQYGKNYIGSNSRYSFFGWFSNGTPSFDYSSGGATGSFVGLAVDQVSATVHCNASKFEIPGRIECSSLAVNGREI